MIPRPPMATEQDFGYTIKTEDAGILKSIAKQLSKNIGMTDRQYALVKRKLPTYKDQFDSKGVDLDTCIDNLKIPLREIDRSHWLRILTYNEEDFLAIRFPFSKKIIDRIQELQSLQDIRHNTQKPQYKDHTHYFTFTPKNVYSLVSIANRFEQKFFIHEEIKTIYNDLKEYENNREDYVPGIFNFEIKNLPEKAILKLEEELGKPSAENLCLYYDRHQLYGIKDFDKEVLEQSILKRSPFTQKIIKRKGPTMLVGMNNQPINDIIDSLFDLNRLPILVVLDTKKAHDSLTIMHNALRNVIKNEDMSVLFRLDSTGKEFNEYIQQNKLNNQVAKNTKVVYISNNKLPKPLLKSGFIPNVVFSYGGKGLSFNNVTQYVQQFDLQIVYEDSTASTYWNKTEGKIIHGNV
tara:strand:- start:2288 stop:3508 length:1221 start_codon:yes stop_codon:yes gene_type:complete